MKINSNKKLTFLIYNKLLFNLSHLAGAVLGTWPPAAYEREGPYVRGRCPLLSPAAPDLPTSLRSVPVSAVRSGERNVIPIAKVDKTAACRWLCIIVDK